MPHSDRFQSLLRLVPGVALVAATAAAGAYALWFHETRISVVDGRLAAEFERPASETLRDSSWMDSVDTYMDERIPGRDSLLAAHAAVAARALGDPVLSGIYLDGPDNQLLERPPALEVRATLGDEAAALADAVGPAKVLWVYAPRKEEVLAQYLPAAWTNPYPTVHDEVVAAYAGNGDVLDLTDLMADRGAAGYFRTDHHWNPGSAKAVADSIAERLQADGVPIGTDDREYGDVTGELPFYGSTGRVVTLGATRPDSVVVPVPEGGFRATMCVDTECGLPTFDAAWLDKGSLYGNRYRAFLGGDEGMRVITNDSPGASGRLIVLADSFGNAVVPYLSERVAQLIVIDERHYEGVPLNALAEQFQPDAVVVLHNPLTLLTPSFRPDVWTTEAAAAPVDGEEQTYDTAVYEDVAVVTEQGLMLHRNRDQPLEPSLRGDARALGAALDEVGIPQVWLYAPRKEEAYPELVPEEYGNPVADKRERVLSYLEAGHEVIDLTPQLSVPELRDTYYYRTDHHWTPAAAAVAVEEIVEGLAEQGLELPHDSRVWRRVDGPLPFSGSDALSLPAGAPRVAEPMWYLEPDGGFRAIMCAEACDQPGLKQEWLTNPDPDANRYYAFLGGGFRTMHLHNDSPHARGTVVMLKDSYSHPVALMLAERVTDLYLVDERGFEGEAFGDYLREVDADGVVVLHNQVTLLSQAFNSEVWRNAGD